LSPEVELELEHLNQFVGCPEYRNSTLDPEPRPVLESEVEACLTL
jgi:hypothetical protein